MYLNIPVPWMLGVLFLHILSTWSRYVDIDRPHWSHLLWLLARVHWIILRISQHTPGTYQNDPQPTVYVSDFLNHLGVKGEASWGMRNRGIPPMNPPKVTNTSGRRPTLQVCISHSIHVWYIFTYVYQILPLKTTKCRSIYHTWMLWV